LIIIDKNVGIQFSALGTVLE